MKKIIILSLFISVFAPAVWSQHTLIYTHSDVLFNQGKELYNQRKFAASYRSFEDFLKSTEVLQAGQIQEAEYYIAANAYELRQEDASILLKKYLQQHPYTPFFDRANTMLACFFTRKKTMPERFSILIR
jgi:hypothetical protein